MSIKILTNTKISNTLHLLKTSGQEVKDLSSFKGIMRIYDELEDQCHDFRAACCLDESQELCNFFQLVTRLENCECESVDLIPPAEQAYYGFWRFLAFAVFLTD